MRLETIKIGRIVNAHGIRGEVRVQPDGQDPAFLTQFQTFYLDGAPVTPTANHVHKSLVLMKFPGVDDMNAALALKGKNLYIRRADAKLPEGACFDAELLGMTVCDAATGETLGEITRVDSYPAHKVYTVRGAREYLIPAVPDVFIKSVDLDANRMEVQVWKGWPRMRIDIMTLFPDSVDAMLNVSILGRAQQRGYISIQSHQIRQYTTNRQMQVDDYPYGGGRGAVMQADPLYRCWSHIVETYGPGRTIFLSPCGRTFTQEVAKELKARYDHLILVCGHYEGVDQRFLDECVDEEISMGDFVLTGGEIPAMAVADAVCRMVPGVLPDAECFEEESHWNGLLEYPQYSRPAEWHGRAVPEILLSGDHGKVAAWRKKQSYKRTMERRPDLFAKFDKSQLTSKADKKILAEAEAEFVAEHPDCAAERAES